MNVEVTYDDVVNFLDKNTITLESKLKELEAILIKEANKDGDKKLPVYITKYRIKSAQSCYLKTKRDSRINELDKITDLAGFRILCLFEEDIFEVHKFILKLATRDRKFFIDHIKIFNWIEAEGKIRKEVFQGHSIPKIEHKPKKTGYKSIHYIVHTKSGRKNLNFEIQLRTLLQDVWGELEHKLCYKQGNIHPHIKKSFELLSRDLQSNDILLNHLKNVYEKQVLFEEYAQTKIGPDRYFSYEETHIPFDLSKLTTDQEILQKYKIYNDFCSKELSHDNDIKVIKRAQKKFAEIRSLIRRNVNLEKKMTYWIEMENAFFLFATNKLDKALSIYNKIIGDDAYNKIAYVPYYRRGEINFIKSDILNALRDFDQSEIISQKRPAMIKASNRYFIKRKLANLYWMLGLEYIDIAIQKIKDAESIFNENKNAFSERDKNYIEISLINNLCWFNLEKNIMLRENLMEKADIKDNAKIEEEALNFSKTKEYFNKIESYLEKIECKNDFDTAAWFCYQTYKRDQSRSYLVKAKKYIMKAVELKDNASISKFMSDNLILNHFQEIMHTE